MPLRFVVPPDAPLELWDSATTQLARSGDTLQRLAALNQSAAMVAYPGQSAFGQCTAVGRPAHPNSAPSRSACRRISGVATETVVQALQRQVGRRNGISIGTRRQYDT